MGGRGASSVLGKRPDIHIMASLGSMFYFANVMDTDGRIVKLKVSSKVTNVEVIAGHGMSRKIDEVKKLQKRHGGKASDWMKVKGIGTIEKDGLAIKVEIHWYEKLDDPTPYDRKVVRYLL